MKRLLAIILISLLIVTTFAACNGTDADIDNKSTEASTQKPTEKPTENPKENTVLSGFVEFWEEFTLDNSEPPSNPGPSETTSFIPTDYDALAEILEDMGLEDVDVVTHSDFLGYEYLGNLECVVGGILPGPEEDVLFFYCADTNTANYAEAYWSEAIASNGQNYYTVKRENNIVFFGPAEVWEDLSK